MTRRGMLGAVALVALALGFSPERSVGADRYFVLIFGAQPTPKIIKDSHTWATFVRVVGEGTDPSSFQVFAHTISFVPASLKVRTFALDAESGLNLDLEATLSYARTRNAGVTVWGPFNIRTEAYQRSLEVWSLVNSGAVEYRAIDTLKNQFISDCIHAVTAVDPTFGRGHYPLIRTGKSASRYISRQIVRRGNPDRTLPDQTWLIPTLGLDRPEIEVILPSQIPKRRSILAPRGD